MTLNMEESMTELELTHNEPDDGPKATSIVAIGASAGGLSALEQFFDSMPSDSGMAFVIIQHLSPDFKSLMDDLLSRHTSMSIYRVTNGIELQPNSIYLIPPKAMMTIKHERLYLTEKVVSQHLELPIDIFFKSLASDAGDRAIGIILSGTGSDGSSGILSIHNSGGLVLIQSPESAQFDGMPRSAIASGVCDFILSPDRMPSVLMEYADNPAMIHSRLEHTFDVFENEGEYAEVFALLRRNYQLDFSKYKGATVGRRVRRRMEFRQITEISDYAAILAGDQGEMESLYKDLLIGVTEFFRDKQTFQFLESDIIPSLFDNLRSNDDLRVWSAACATGEEAYSLAILLAEQAEAVKFTGKITVFASDVHKASLDFASQGLYGRAQLANVKPERLERFFRKETGDLFRVTSDLRKLVLFAPHNLLKDPLFTRLDLVSCRNLLIYFQPAVQEKVISLFHFALKTNSVLFLGSSEGLGAFADEFEVINSHHKIFRKIRDLKLAVDMESVLAEKDRNVPVTVFQPVLNRMVSMDRQVLYDYDLLLRKHMPPGVLINENRHVIHYFGNVAEYLKMPEGRAENDILLLVEDNLHIALSTAFLRIEKSRQTLITRNVRVKRGADEFLIDLTVDPLVDEKIRTTHFHIYFERVRSAEITLPSEEQPEELDEKNLDTGKQFRQHVTDLEMELQSTRENLQTTVEELQTSNEELQATNEELLASNEELQSTNEELHSVNEELYSVNSEFERKNIDLKQLNTDHDNLLGSIDIGTIFLDRQMRIRKYNPAIAAFFKLLPQDVGCPIDHIAYHLSPREELLADIGLVLGSGAPIEKEENTRDGKWLLIKIMPFKTETGQLEGVVITFTDISRSKAAEQDIIKLNEGLEQKVLERTSALQKEFAARLEAEHAQRNLKEQLMHSQKMEAVGELADGVAHDFNNILQVIMGHCSLLRMRMPTDNPELESIQVISEAAERASHLTRRLLAFSRKQVMVPKVTNLNVILEHTIQFLRRLIGAHIAFETALSPEPLNVLCDSNQLDQALINLATNAQDAMPEGGILTLRSGYRDPDESTLHQHGNLPSGRYAYISLSDTGKGIDDETRQRMFEPFFTTKQVGRGTGLGLSIVFSIMQQHNGFVDVTSELLKGTEFTIYLPVCTGDVKPAEDTYDEPTHNGREMILVAEDDPQVRYLTAKTLSDLGYNVITAEDGQDVVDKFIAHQDQIKLLVLDAIMPRKNGMKAYEEISAVAPGIPALFISGYSAEFIQGHGKVAEGADFLMKPINALELARKVRKALDREHHRQKPFQGVL